MNVLLSGILPERDWSGNDVPGGGGYVAERWRGSLIQRSSCALSSDSRTGTQLAMCAGSAVRRTQSVSSGQLLATVRVGVPQGGRTQLTWPSSSRSPLFSGVIGLLLSCVMFDVLHCMNLGITAHVVAIVFMRCIQKRAWAQHTRRTVNDSTTRSALGTDRKERCPNSKES